MADEEVQSLCEGVANDITTGGIRMGTSPWFGDSVTVLVGFVLLEIRPQLRSGIISLQVSQPMHVRI